MQYQTNILLLSYNEVIPAIIKEGTFKWLKSQGKIQTTHRGCNGHPVEILYDSLPQQYKDKLPSRDQLIKQCQAGQTEKEVTETAQSTLNLIKLHESKFINRQDFQYYKFKCGLKTERAHDLMIVVAWLRLLAQYRTPSDCRAIGFSTKQALRQAVVDILKGLSIPLYKFRISNAQTLQRRELEWCKLRGEEALAAQLHAGTGNDNSRRIGRIYEDDPENQIMLPGAKIDLREFHAGTLMYLFMNPGSGNIFDYEEIYARYCILCAEKSEKPRSLSAIKNFLGRDDVLQYTNWERKGYPTIDKLLPQITRKRPEYSLTKGGVDGFQVDFYTDIDSKSRVMLTIVAFFDLSTEAITGYEVAINESGEAVRNAYRNHLRRWGKAYQEIESDRGSSIIGKDSAWLINRFSQYKSQAGPSDPRGKAPNPKRRFAERLILELNRLTQSIPGWKGTNITSQRHHAGKPNPDYSTGAQASLEQGIMCINKLIALYNNELLEKYGNKSRMQVFQETMNPEAMAVSPEMLAYTFNKSTVTTVRNSLITITVNRKDHTYPFPENLDLTSRLPKGRKVRVYFDETDLSTIDVFGFTDPNNTSTDYHLATLGKVVRVQGAKAEQKHEDLAELGRQTRVRNQYQEKIERKMLEVEAGRYELDINSFLPIADLRKLVEGARARYKNSIVQPFDKRHELVLTTEEARAELEWNNQTMLRDKNMRVPLSPSPVRDLDEADTRQARKEFLKSRIKNNNQ